MSSSSYLQALQLLSGTSVLHTLLDEERSARVLYVGVQLDRDGALLEHSLHLVGAPLAQLAAAVITVLIVVVFVVSVGAVEVPHEAWEDEAGFGVVLGVPVVRGVAELLRIIAATPEQTCIIGECDKHAFVLHVSPV